MEDNKQLLADKLNNLIKITVIIGILLISGSISYYFIIFLPQQERIRINALKQKDAELKQKEETRKNSLDLCLNMAEADYRSLIKANSKGVMGSMPLELMKAIDKRYHDTKDDCYKKFPPERPAQ